MAALEFCDTNVLVYAYDRSAGPKRIKARAILERLWKDEAGVVSIQVLQELFVTLTRKLAPALLAADARGIVEDLATWRVVEPSARDILSAIDLSLHFQIAFWDAMIVVAAQRGSAAIIWSEDLNSSQVYDGARVINPFA